MRALVLVATLAAGCYDYDRLERLYVGGGGDGGAQDDAAGHEALDGSLAGSTADLAEPDPQGEVADLASSGPPADLTPLCTATRCDGKCVDLDSDPRNCGACGYDCTALIGVDGAKVGCVAGQCDLTAACVPGRGNCTSFPGCETDLTTPQNCGVCGKACSVGTALCSSTGASFSCVSTCPSDTPTQCGSSCVDTTSNPDHCGGCPNPCPLPSGAIARSCVASQCGFTCGPDFRAQSGACIAKVLAKQTSGTDAVLHQVWGSGAGDVWVAGNGIILHSTGNGVWENRTSDAPAGDWHSVWGTSANNVYLSGTVGIIRSTNGGAHWSALLASVHVEQIWGSGASDIYGVDRYDQVYRSTNGTSFSAQSVSGNWWAVWGNGPGEVFIGGQPDVLMARSTGNGSWTAQSPTGFTTLWAGWSPSPSLVYAVGNFGYIVKRGSDGIWRPQVNANNAANIGVWGSGASDVWTVGYGGMVQRSTDGANWEKVTSGTMNKLRAVWGPQRGDLYIVGDAGTILHTE